MATLCACSVLHVAPLALLSLAPCNRRRPPPPSPRRQHSSQTATLLGHLRDVTHHAYFTLLSFESSFHEIQDGQALLTDTVCAFAFEFCARPPTHVAHQATRRASASSARALARPRAV
eukprot:5230926-Pleurochrysis_carterae.AAC.2